jgi:hypothetical protein
MNEKPNKFLDSNIDNFLDQKSNVENSNLTSGNDTNSFKSQTQESIKINRFNKNEVSSISKEVSFNDFSFLKCRKCKRTGHTKSMCVYNTKVNF